MPVQRARVHVSIYLGQREEAAMARCPAGMQRGRWINLLAGQIAAWPEEQWASLSAHLAPRPSPRTGKLSIALRADLAAALDRRRGRIPIADVLRTALLRAAGIPYQPIPTVAPWPAPVPPPLAEPKAAAAASTGSLPTIEEARSELERRYTDLERQLAETRREGKELSRRWKRHADKLARELAAARSELAVHERDAPRTVEWIKRLQQQVIDLGGDPVGP